MDTELKCAIRNYQGKYFKGQELENKPTYVFIRKVQKITQLNPEEVRTFSDVLGYSDKCVAFWQNRVWYSGKKYITDYGYKEIKKSEFIKAVTSCGFENKKPKDFISRKYRKWYDEHMQKDKVELEYED